MTNRKRLSAAVRHKIHEKYGGRCAYCGQPIEYKEMQVDHMVPLHRGGKDSEDNYLPACRTCNYYKHTLTIENFRKEIRLITQRLRNWVFGYRMALKYGLISENEGDVQFYFEKVSRGNSCDNQRHDDE